LKQVLGYYLGFLIFIMLLTGCAPSKESIIPGDDGLNIPQHERIKISRGKTIGYAYLNKDGKLINLSKEYIHYKREEKVEFVELTDNGFYPENYFLGEIACNKSSWTDVYENRQCYSIFSKANIPDAALRNGLIAVSTLGFGLLYGGSSSIKTFEENNLIEKRDELLSSFEPLQSEIESIDNFIKN